MLILYLVFIIISTCHCVEDPVLQITHSMCKDDAVVIQCVELESISYLNQALRSCFELFKVLRFENCSSMSVLTHFVQTFLDWRRPEVLFTFEASNLGWNSLDSKDFLKYTRSMWKLIADHNELKTLPAAVFADANELNYLDLSYNQFENIESIGEASVAALETLLISHNNIVIIRKKTFKHFNRLSVLDLSSNNLTFIEDGAFDLVPNMKNLSMAHNFLSHLDFGMFTRLTSMESIDISNNVLHSVDFRVHLPVFRHLKHINMESNKINAAYGLDSSTFPYLSYLSLRNNSFDCGKLQNILSTFDLKQMDLGMDPSERVKAGNAFRGIACQPPEGDFVQFGY